MKQTNLRRPVRDLYATKPKQRSVVISSVYGWHQLDRFSCGAAVVFTVLAAVSGKVNSEQWETICAVASPCPELGTDTEHVAQAVKAVGLGCRNLRGKLSCIKVRNIIRRGNLLITTVRMPHQISTETHWVVVAGWSEDGLLILNCTGLPFFSKRWYSWYELDEFTSSEDDALEVQSELTAWVVDRTNETQRMKVS